MMSHNLVKFRYGTPVTADYPDLAPGTFTFDSESLALYLDTDTRRVQVQDPLKLSLTGGTLTGSLQVVSNDGATKCSLNHNTGVIQGDFLETTGDISLDAPPGLYAVIDENGRIRTRTVAQMKSDLNIIDPTTLGALAYKDSAYGVYVPVGTVSTPDVTIECNTENVVKTVTAGDLPTYEVSGELLSLNPGTQTTSSSTDVVKDIASVTVSQPVFTGTEATITVS